MVLALTRVLVLTLDLAQITKPRPLIPRLYSVDTTTAAAATTATKTSNTTTTTTTTTTTSKLLENIYQKSLKNRNFRNKNKKTWDGFGMVWG